MPPHANSRHLFCEGYIDVDGATALTPREPFRFRDLADNRVHTVFEGDTLWTIAGTYFADLARPSGYWWAIADFQPQPIVDPTIALEPGTEIVIPSSRVLLTSILGEQRRRVH